MRIRRFAAWAAIPAAVIGALLAPTGATAGGLPTMTIDPTEVEVGPDTTEVAVTGTGCVQEREYEDLAPVSLTPGVVDVTLKDPDGVTQDTADDGSIGEDGIWETGLTLPANPQIGTWSVDAVCTINGEVCADECGTAARRFVRTGPFITYDTQFLEVTAAEVAADDAEADVIEAEPTFTG